MTAVRTKCDLATSISYILMLSRSIKISNSLIITTGQEALGITGQEVQFVVQIPEPVTDTSQRHSYTFDRLLPICCGKMEIYLPIDLSHTEK